MFWFNLVPLEIRSICALVVPKDCCLFVIRYISTPWTTCSITMPSFFWYFFPFSTSASASTSFPTSFSAFLSTTESAEMIQLVLRKSHLLVSCFVFLITPVSILRNSKQQQVLRDSDTNLARKISTHTNTLQILYWIAIKSLGAFEAWKILESCFASGSKKYVSWMFKRFLTSKKKKKNKRTRFRFTNQLQIPIQN